MYGVVMGLHILICFGLVGTVLIQSGKGGGLAGGAFGGATQTVFGGRGANDFITRATIGLGIAFFATSVFLALLTAGGGTGGQAKSLIPEEARKAATQQQQQQRSGQSVPVPQGAGAPSAPAPQAGGKR